MKTIKISEFAWNASCPKCKEHIDIVGDFDITDGDIIVCPFCNEKLKIKMVSTIGDMI